MEYVSLLPPEIKSRKLAQKKQRKILLVLFILLLLVLVIFAFLWVSAFLVKLDLKSIQSERESIEEAAAVLKEYEILYDHMTAKERKINAAMGTAPLWDELLRDTSRAIATGTWLSNLILTYDDQSGLFNMRGWAFDQSGVAIMLERLSALEQMNQVQIRTIVGTEYEGRDAVEFQVEGEILSGPAYIADLESGD